ncbi:MAG: DUF445 domain-containing protein [Elainellaceae cyanobacterium]
MALPNLWLLIAPPAIGGIIGYFTNDLAIKMLFRPYRPVYVGRKQLPFTPGLIPGNQGRLAKRIADTIMQSLLTPEELQKLARRLLALERMQSAIGWLLQMAVEQVGPNEEKATRIVAGILEDLAEESLPKLLKSVARNEDFLEPQFNQVFDRVLLELQLTEAQAEQVSAWLLTTVLAPDTLRQGIVDFLTDRNIRTIDDAIRAQTTGTYWVVANIIGLRNTLIRLRTYCLEEQDASNEKIARLIQQLGVKGRLQEWIQNFSLQNLPVYTVRQIRQTAHRTLREYLYLQGGKLLKDLGESVDWRAIASLLVDRLRSSKTIAKSLVPVSNELALILERYLERDLETIVAQVIPILNIDQVIIERVNATSPQELEVTIQGIVRNELQAIVNLGGILGFTIGLLQAVFLVLQ